MPTISVIISFYKRVDYLRLVFAGLERQTFNDFEVIIADDGSDETVKKQVQQLRHSGPFPTRYVWHEDRGFRKNKILNCAIRAAQSPYLIFIDGDCVLHRNFIREHYNYRAKQVCLSGKRVLLSEKLTELLSPDKVSEGCLEHHFWKLVFDNLAGQSTLVEKGWYFKNPLLRKLINSKNRGLIGCNFSLYKNDIAAINGFDERYELPYVGEDTDVEYRLRLNGVSIQPLYNIAIQYHLFHPKQPRSGKNLAIFNKVQKMKTAYTPYGIINRNNLQNAQSSDCLVAPIESLDHVRYE